MMSKYNNILSVCHLADIMLDDNPKHNDRCSFCGKTAEPISDFVGEYVFELTVRRYKDGDVAYEEVSRAFNDALRESRDKILEPLRNHLRGDKKPKYEYSIQHLKWVAAPKQEVEL